MFEIFFIFVLNSFKKIRPIRLNVISESLNPSSIDKRKSRSFYWKELPQLNRTTFATYTHLSSLKSDTTRTATSSCTSCKKSWQGELNWRAIVENENAFWYFLFHSIRCCFPCKNLPPRCFDVITPNSPFFWNEFRRLSVFFILIGFFFLRIIFISITFLCFFFSYIQQEQKKSKKRNPIKT